MKYGGILLIFTLIILILTASSANAEILLSQTQSLYNLGDDFSVNIDIKEQSQKSDFLTAKIACENGEADVYKAPLSLKAGEQKTISLGINLNSLFIGDLKGLCSLKVSYNDESAESQRFTISNEIILQISSGSGIFDPGANFTINGSAIKRNGKRADGFAEAYISELGLSVKGQVQGGNLRLIFGIPENAKAKSYDLIVRVYESNGKILNEGYSNLSFKVKQVIKSIDIALSSQEINPGDELIYTVLVYDQAGEQILTGASSSTLSPDGKESRKIIQAGQAQILQTANSTSPGFWTLKTEAGNVKFERLFYVNEKLSVEFILKNDSLIIRNTGNVVYDKDVEIKIGGVSEIRRIKINVDEEKRFKLNAPAGDYIVEAGEGGSVNKIGSSFLTGDAISIKDEKERPSFILGVSWIWVILLIILGLIAIFYYLKISKRDFIGKAPVIFNMPLKHGNMIEEGEKEESSVIAFRIKNKEKLGDNAKIFIEKAIEEAKNEGFVSSLNDYNIVLFAPSLTKSKNNSMNSVKTAQRIKSIFDEYNEKYSPKINYGIAVHNGPVIIQKKPELRFSTWGNTIPLTKKITEYSNNDVLISDFAHRTIASTTRCEKIHDRNVWRLRSLSNREKHSKFISNFMEKNF